MNRAAAFFTSFCLLLGCGEAPPSGGTTFQAEPYQVQTSRSGALTIALRTAPQPPTRGIVNLEYTFTTVDGGTVEGLALDVLPFMPDMGHGTGVEPVVTSQGLGRYLVTNVYLSMPGRWELRTTIAGTVDDSTTVFLDIP